MSGICSRHQHHEAGCKLCEAIPASPQSLLEAKLLKRLEIAQQALEEIREICDRMMMRKEGINMDDQDK